MSRHIHLATHLSVEDLAQRSRAAHERGRSAGGAAGGVGRPGARWVQAVELSGGSRLDGRPAGASGAGAARLGRAAAPQAPPAGAATAPRVGRSRTARQLQKKVRPLLQAVATACPHAQVELWATDEHRIGLKPLLRRIWAPIGQRPIATVQHRFAWRYLVGFVHPASGRTFFHLATTVSIPIFAVELAEFARRAGASPTKQLV